MKVRTNLQVSCHCTSRTQASCTGTKLRSCIFTVQMRNYLSSPGTKSGLWHGWLERGWCRYRRAAVHCNSCSHPYLFIWTEQNCPCFWPGDLQTGGAQYKQRCAPARVAARPLVWAPHSNAKVFLLLQWWWHVTDCQLNIRCELQTAVLPVAGWWIKPVRLTHRSVYKCVEWLSQSASAGCTLDPVVLFTGLGKRNCNLSLQEGDMTCLIYLINRNQSLSVLIPPMSVLDNMLIRPNTVLSEQSIF